MIHLNNMKIMKIHYVLKKIDQLSIISKFLFLQDENSIKCRTFTIFTVFSIL